MPHHDSLTVIEGNSETAKLARRLDWNGFDIGPPERWPVEARIATQQVFSSPLPMFVALGPKLEVVYNDGFVELLGTKHPGEMGQPHLEIWAEAREGVEPFVNRALAGESLSIKDCLSTSCVEKGVSRYGSRSPTTRYAAQTAKFSEYSAYVLKLPKHIMLSHNFRRAKASCSSLMRH